MEACSAMADQHLPPPSTKLAAHSQSVLCCHAPLCAPRIVASSSQDGTVCLFDLRNKDTVQRFQCFGGEAVTSICFSPVSSDILYAAAGTAVYCLDARLGSLGREVQKYNFNSEEINQVTLNQKASYLATADDSGETKVIDVHSHTLLKTLRGIHTNICSTVQFHPQRPWEIITGGLDAKIVKWDFSKGRPLKVVDLGNGTATAAANSLGSGQFCNPPLVHVLATPEDKLSGEAEKLLAVAKGDGAVSICNVALEKRKGLQTHALKLRNSSRDRKSKGEVMVQETDTFENLDAAVGGHTAAVSCVTFARFAQNGSLIISGSNDRSIKVWTLSQKDMKVASEGDPLSRNGGPLNLNINHKKKVNWLSTATTSSENLFVADTSSFLTVYTIL